MDSENVERTAQVEELLEALRQAGGISGNTSLSRDLGWDTETFYSVRNHAEELGLVRKGRGRGGSTLLDEEEEAAVRSDEELAEEIVNEIRQESDLYGPVKQTLESDWVNDSREGSFESMGVVDTSHQGRRSTGGKWTRPDLALIAAQKLEFFPDDHFEIITFELKLASAVDPTSVYEALSHRRAAHRAILIVFAHEEQEFESTAFLDTQEVAREHGIGLITIVSDVLDYSNWETIESAARVEPDPRRANRFISDQLQDLHGHLRDRLASAQRDALGALLK